MGFPEESERIVSVQGKRASGECGIASWRAHLQLLQMHVFFSFFRLNLRSSSYPYYSEVQCACAAKH